jgi:hypothetical protein
MPHHPVTFLPGDDTLAHFSHFAGKFHAGRDRIARAHIAGLINLTAVKAGCPDPDQDLSGTDDRGRDVLHLDYAAFGGWNDTHCFHCSLLRVHYYRTALLFRF